tara:strand:- start:289 stop:804 length:516 start_codon:yes stop_codon:yes gene_type:complete
MHSELGFGSLKSRNLSVLSTKEKVKLHDIITDEKLLTIPCVPVKDFDEGKKIADILFEILADQQNGIGLAANQIGINKAVCVVNITAPLWFLNPEFVPANDAKINFNEACLSFPEKTVITERYKEIYVTSNNFDNVLHFGPWNVLECVCVQHEISHLLGKTMYDFEVNNEK